MTDRHWRAFAIGVGTNLGDRAGQIGLVTGLLAASGGCRRLRVARPISTDPVVPEDRVESHPAYLNTAIVGETTCSPVVLMGRLLAIEAACGRRRRGAVDPRTLDLDLLVFDGVRVERPGLDLPHPRLAGRRFVLDPLLGLLDELDRHGSEDDRRLVGALEAALCEAGVSIPSDS